MSRDSEPFLSRWSRRKIESVESAREVVQPANAPEPGRIGGSGAAAAAATVPGVVAVNAAVSPPLAEVPTTPPLPPVESLDGLQSDYAAFFQQPVADALKRAALKKLFSDPHFNQMDGLDVYIDDYTQFEPLEEAARLRLLGSSEFVNRIEQLSDAVPAAEANPGVAVSAHDAERLDAGTAEGPDVNDGAAARSDVAAEQPPAAALPVASIATSLPADGEPVESTDSEPKPRP